MTGEHERYARYLLEFANVAEDGEPDLVRVVLTDPDQVMLRAVTRDEGRRENEPTSASDWLQRRACAAPALLTEQGRTRSVRTAAGQAREGV